MRMAMPPLSAARQLPCLLRRHDWGQGACTMGADEADDRVRSAVVENGIQRAVATNAQPERLRKAVQSSAAHSGHRRHVYRRH